MLNPVGLLSIAIKPLLLCIGFIITFSPMVAAHVDDGAINVTASDGVNRQSTQITIEDSRGTHVLPSVPTRVAALNWDIAEQVLELGVTPVAIPDIVGYKEWVMNPVVPDDVMDIGTRIEPNFQRLAALKPDVIIIASPQLDLLPRLEKIAPVLFFQTYSEHHDNAQAALDNFFSIAKLLGKSAEAQARIAQMHGVIASQKQQLLKAYDGKLPKVSTFRFASMTSVYLYGDNSTAQYALSLLGIEPAIDIAATQWGVKQQRLKLLSHVDDGVALYFEPFAQEAELSQSVMWNAMPFVRHNKMNSIEPAWNYGGAISIEYMAQALTRSLLAIAPNSPNAPDSTHAESNKERDDD